MGYMAKSKTSNQQKQLKLKRRPIMKKMISFMLAVCLLSSILVFSAIAAYTCDNCYSYTATGEVCVDNAYLYEEHSFSSDLVHTDRMPRYRDVYIMKACPVYLSESYSNGWFYVRIVYYGTTLYGWMYGDYITNEHEELRKN